MVACDECVELLNRHDGNRAMMYGIGWSASVHLEMELVHGIPFGKFALEPLMLMMIWC